MKDSELVEEMGKRFGLNELRMVCFDAGIAYDNLPHHNTRSGLATAMVQYAHRHGTEGQLLAALARNNKAFKWAKGEIEITEPEEVDPTPTVRLVDPMAEERDRVLEGLGKPSLYTLAAALAYIIRRL